MDLQLRRERRAGRGGREAAALLSPRAKERGKILQESTLWKPAEPRRQEENLPAKQPAQLPRPLGLRAASPCLSQWSLPGSPGQLRPLHAALLADGSTARRGLRVDRARGQFPKSLDSLQPS